MAVPLRLMKMDFLIAKTEGTKMKQQIGGVAKEQDKNAKLQFVLQMNL